MGVMVMMKVCVHGVVVMMKVCVHGCDGDDEGVCAP